MNYWEECISQAADECGLVLTEEQLRFLTEAVKGSHESYGMAFGHDSIPNPLTGEITALKARIHELEEGHLKCIQGIKEGAAARRGVSVNDVFVSENGDVTYNLV